MQQIKIFNFFNQGCSFKRPEFFNKFLSARLKTMKNSSELSYIANEAIDHIRKMIVYIKQYRGYLSGKTDARSLIARLRDYQCILNEQCFLNKDLQKLLIKLATSLSELCRFANNKLRPTCKTSLLNISITQEFLRRVILQEKMGGK
jgi:hypothetical protein